MVVGVVCAVLVVVATESDAVVADFGAASVKRETEAGWVMGTCCGFATGLVVDGLEPPDIFFVWMVVGVVRAVLVIVATESDAVVGDFGAASVKRETEAGWVMGTCCGFATGLVVEGLEPPNTFFVLATTDWAEFLTPEASMDGVDDVAACERAVVGSIAIVDANTTPRARDIGLVRKKWPLIMALHLQILRARSVHRPPHSQ